MRRLEVAVFLGCQAAALALFYVLTESGVPEWAALFAQWAIMLPTLAVFAWVITRRNS